MRVRRETFLPAEFLWMVPAEAAFWMTGTASLRVFSAVALSPASTAMINSFVRVLIRVRLIWLLSRLLRLCLCLLIADLCVANCAPPEVALKSMA